MTISITSSETLTSLSNNNTGLTFNSINVSSGVVLDISSAANNAINNSNQFSVFSADTGVIINDNGGFDNSNGGLLELAGATVSVAQDFGNNSAAYGVQSNIEITNASTLTVGTLDSANGIISFYGSGNVLNYATLGSGLGTITSFGTGDEINLTGTSYASTDSLVSNGTIVSLVDGSTTLASFSTVGGETFSLTQGASGEIEITNGPAIPFSSTSSLVAATMTSINNVSSNISFTGDLYLTISSFPTNTLINNSNGGVFTAGKGDIILDNGGFDNYGSNLTLMGYGTLAVGELDQNQNNNDSLGNDIPENAIFNNTSGTIIAGIGEVISDYGNLANNGGFTSLAGNGSLSVYSTVGIDNSNGGTILSGAGEVISTQGGLLNSGNGIVSLAGNGTISILGFDGPYFYTTAMPPPLTGINSSNSGTFSAGAGETIIVQDGLSNVNGGVFSLSGASATIGSQINNGSNGTIDLANGSTFISTDILNGSGGTIAFQGSHNDLAVRQEGQNYGTITGFGTGDVIDLTGSTYNSTDSLVVSGTVVSVVGTITQDGYPPTTETFANFSTVTGESFTLIDGANGEIEIVCFLKGTHIATAQGAIEVQNLRAGDMVLTAQGEAKPIRWLGRSTISPRFADPLRAAPIRITAGALADNLPVRDLLVSPAHAMFINGVLVQAGALVNGTSIRREAMGEDNFTYYHVELDSHELILAENTACESFIDNIDRMNFDNWAERESSEPMVEMAYPRAKSARQVPSALRQQIAARATLTSPDTRVA